MGIFSSLKQTNPYAPPLPQDSGPLRSTMLGGAEQNGASGGATALVRVADDPPPQISPPAQGSDNSRKASNYYLKFDGRYLRLHDGDNVVKEWPGVSGKENFGSRRDQEKRNYGPIPEGTYDIKQSRYEKMDELRQRLAACCVGRAGPEAGEPSGCGLTLRAKP
jgi:hypothetical protein